MSHNAEAFISKDYFGTSGTAYITAYGWLASMKEMSLYNYNTYGLLTEWSEKFFNWCEYGMQ